MFNIDVPYPTNQVSIVLIARADFPPTSSRDDFSQQKLDKTFKSCQDVENTVGAPDRPSNQFPVLPVFLERLGYRWDSTNYNVPTNIEAQIRSSVIEKPSYGKVTLIDAKNHIWAYEANTNYLGKDRASFLIEAKGTRFKTVVDLAVIQGINENEDPACSSMFRPRKVHR